MDMRAQQPGYMHLDLLMLGISDESQTGAITFLNTKSTKSTTANRDLRSDCLKSTLWTLWTLWTLC